MFIKTLIRKKKLSLAESQQKLSHLRNQERYHQELIDLQTALIERERAKLNDQFSLSNEISIQQLILAKAYVSKVERSVTELSAKVKLQKQTIAQLEERARRSNKEVEKLEEIAHDRLQQSRVDATKDEWVALDQWVINRRGRRL